MPLKQNIKCSTCGKRIRGTKDVEFKERMAKLRKHRKKYHPKAHKKSVKKALKTKRKKGIINKKGSKKPKKPEGEGWKWNSKAKHWVKRKKKGRGFEFK